MARISRIINYTITDANTWYKVFQESDYKNNIINELTVKFRETATADHFRYNYDGSTSVFMTSTSGMVTLRNVKELHVYVPTTAAQIIEIEIIYK